MSAARHLRAVAPEERAPVTSANLLTDTPTVQYAVKITRPGADPVAASVRDTYEAALAATRLHRRRGVDVEIVTREVTYGEWRTA